MHRSQRTVGPYHWMVASHIQNIMLRSDFRILPQEIPPPPPKETTASVTTKSLSLLLLRLLYSQKAAPCCLFYCIPRMQRHVAWFTALPKCNAMLPSLLYSHNATPSCLVYSIPRMQHHVAMLPCCLINRFHRFQIILSLHAQGDLWSTFVRRCAGYVESVTKPVADRGFSEHCACSGPFSVRRTKPFWGGGGWYTSPRTTPRTPLLQRPLPTLLSESTGGTVLPFSHCPIVPAIKRTLTGTLVLQSAPCSASLHLAVPPSHFRCEQ
jgi:hypothetical protein